MLEIKKCPSCDNGEIKKIRRNWTGIYKGKAYTVPNLRYYECAECGERIYDRDAMQEIEAHSPAFAGGHPERKSA